MQRKMASPPLRLLFNLLFFFSLSINHSIRHAQAQELPVEIHTYSSFHKSDEGTLKVLNDAHINNQALQLTPDSRNTNPSFHANKSGSVLLNRPFTLWQLRDDRTPVAEATDGNGNYGATNSCSCKTARVVSFNSTFSINVDYGVTKLPGEGLTFLIAPSLAGPPPGSYGGFLGLTNETLNAKPASNRFVAIEFDTFKQAYDPNDNHVGLNIGSVNSTKTANLTEFDIRIATTNQTSANYTVWIEYNGTARHIWVYMGIRGKAKPVSPVLDEQLDLRKHVPEKSYIGFSASTGPYFELNCVLDWNLTIETFPEDSKRAWLVPVIVVVPIAAVAISIGTFFLIRMHQLRRPLKMMQERVGQTLSSLPGMPREFEYRKIRKATKNFDDRAKLGKGGYGMVYKGVLPAEDGRPEATEVAVKRFIRDGTKCVDDFVTEVDIINRLRHKNIVSLIGWCYKKGQLLLVYEYMPNGSLDQHLFRRGVHDQRPVLSWQSRYSIVADVASGLHYVHHEYGRMVLHRDIKASNVMLDAAFHARLGDFGLARVIEFDKNSFTDLGVAGTRGYIAPEYSVGHKATRQTDVFAFGALVLEIVTGQCALLGDPRCPLLSDWVWRLHGRGALLGAVDQNLGNGEFDADEANRLLLLGLACSNPNPADRPTMPQVLQIVSKSAPPPEVPAFKPAFMWPPEGGESFDQCDIELSGGSFTGTGNGTSAHATQDSYSSFEGRRMAPDSADYFAMLSSGR